jgi:hypothetical protein
VSNKQLAWVLAAAIGGGLLVLMFMVQITQTTSRNSLKNVSVKCVERNDQCEKIAENRLFAEPENTISNLAYLVAGILIIVRTLRSGFDERRVPALCVGLSFCFLAVCSAYYHGTLNGIQAQGRLEVCTPDPPRLPQILDIVGVYLSLLSMICYGLDRLMRKRLQFEPLSALTIAIAVGVALAVWLVYGPLGNQKVWFATGLGIWLLCGVWAAGIALMQNFGAPAAFVWFVWGLILLVNTLFSAGMKTVFGFDSEFVFPVLVGLLLAVAAMNIVLPERPGGEAWRASPTELLLVASAFTIGMLLRVSDGPGHPLCKADWVLQPHAAWHVMSAIALLLTFELVEKSNSARGTNDPDGNAAALLPAAGTVEAWLNRKGPVLGRGVGALFINIACFVIALGFGFMMLVRADPMAVASIIPLFTAVWLAAKTYVGEGTN